MADYLQHIKEISDSLTAAGASVSDRDLIAATLAGLLDEFESFIDSIMLRLSSTSLDELHGLLLTKELSMTRRKKIASSATIEPFHALSVQASPPLLPTPPQAFAAQHPPLQHSFRSNSNRGRNNLFSNNQGTYNSSNNRGNYNSGNNRGNYNSGHNRGNYNSGFISGFNRGHNSNSRGSFSSGVRIPCQICGNTSHEAIDCFDRMNPEISGRIPPSKLAAMCAHYTSKPSPPSWLIDSGATSHITNDISNISSPSPYTGEDKVYIGDGKGLSINHIGSSLLHTTSTSFKLKNVLHVP